MIAAAQKEVEKSSLSTDAYNLSSEMREEIVTSRSFSRVWINPWKYWAATANLTSEEIETLMEKISAEIEAGNEEGLRRFDFVSLENPYFAWRETRKSRFPRKAA